MGRALAAAALVTLVGCAGQVAGPPPIEAPVSLPRPMAIEALRASRFDTRLLYERKLDDGASFTAYLVSYEHAGLKLHAMVAVPGSRRPAAGYPLIIANHGYVPDPRKYGITKDGLDARPGDYYRSVPELFTSRGFLVVIPDFRGHNSSEGFEYIDPQDEDAIAYYAEDVVALMSGLADIGDADLDRVFMWSHSMGGAVSMRALLATDMVKASSFWATMNVDDLRPYLGDLDGPVMIQHAIGDTAAECANSERLAAALGSIAHPHVLHLYDSDDHYFEGDLRELAADRDAAFFRGFPNHSPESRD